MPGRRGLALTSGHLAYTGAVMSHPDAGLDDRDQELLDFERDWPAHEGRKGHAIRTQFGITPARYYQLLHRVLDLPAAAAYDPLTVKRLRRRRDERARKRADDAVGGDPGPPQR